MPTLGTHIPKPIFVFGSNIEGRHDKGAALYARNHCGAICGVSEGHMGTSYAIPTKCLKSGALPMQDITDCIDRFIAFAKDNDNMLFIVTRIGCGLAGLRDADVAPLFSNAPVNCILPSNWKEYTPERDATPELAYHDNDYAARIITNC